MDKQQWQAFTGDKPAREAAQARWLELNGKLADAQRLLFDERWSTDDLWPGVIYGGPTGDGLNVVDLETWALMRALVCGMGEALQRTIQTA